MRTRQLRPGCLQGRTFSRHLPTDALLYVALSATTIPSAGNTHVKSMKRLVSPHPVCLIEEHEFYRLTCQRATVGGPEGLAGSDGAPRARQPRGRRRSRRVRRTLRATAVESRGRPKAAVAVSRRAAGMGSRPCVGASSAWTINGNVEARAPTAPAGNGMGGDGGSPVSRADSFRHTFCTHCLV